MVWTFPSQASWAQRAAPHKPSQSQEATPPADGLNILAQASKVLNQIAYKATPAVVSITSIRTGRAEGPPINLLGISPEASDTLLLGVGSGVVVRSDGLILTNLHVVQNSEKITVLLDDTHKASAHLVGGDAKTDLAVIQLDQPAPKPLPTLHFALSSALHVGDWIIAVGSPFGLSHSVTSGIISAVGRGQLGMLEIEDFIQTDAAINPGNSGGPLLDSNGEMIGINTAIFSQTGSFTGIGFAIPSKIAKQVLDEIVEHGRVIRGWMGALTQDLDSNLATYFKSPRQEGALISQIQIPGPAYQAHLKTGDIITQFGTHAIRSAGELKSLVASTPATTQVPIHLLRDGKALDITVSIREQPTPQGGKTQQQAGKSGLAQHAFNTHGQIGVSVQDVSTDLAQLLRAPFHTGAIVAEVQPGSPGFEAGLTVGDVILSANQKEIHNAQEFFNLLDQLKPGEMTVLYVQKTPEEKVFIPLKKS